MVFLLKLVFCSYYLLLLEKKAHIFSAPLIHKTILLNLCSVFTDNRLLLLLLLSYDTSLLTTKNIPNCTCDKSVVKGGNQTITVIANEGYQLNSNIVLYDAGTSVTSSYSDFTDENTKCVITHNVKGNLRITATAIKKTEKLSKEIIRNF